MFWQHLGKRYPELNLRERKQKLIELELGENFSKVQALLEKDFILNEAVEIAAAIAKILEQLEIFYFIGNELASISLGERCTTDDADIVVLFQEDKVQQFIEAMESDFYIGEIAIEDALRDRTNTFNVIHFTSVIKADIYPIRANDKYRITALTRRIKIHPDGFPSLSFYICAAEDIVLQKLICYRIAGNKSEKQWRDVLGVLKANGANLDFDYLNYWASELKVTEECDRALTEAGLK